MSDVITVCRHLIVIETTDEFEHATVKVAQVAQKLSGVLLQEALPGESSVTGFRPHAHEVIPPNVGSEGEVLDV